MPVTIPNINLFSDNELILNPIIAIESPEATTSKSTATTMATSHVASSSKSTATTPKSKAKSMAKSMATTPKLTATTSEQTEITSTLTIPKPFKPTKTITKSLGPPN